MADAPAVRPHHFRWDLDKTYLRTEFDTLRDLIRTAMQSAAEKRAVPGAPCLLRELLAGATADAPRRVTFISGSPRQMRRVLAEKLRLDGIEPEDFILKPNLQNLLLFRFRALRSQVGYKLGALLESRATGLPLPESLFGDDAERDAFIYSLYADLLAGRVESDALSEILEVCRVSKVEAARVQEALSAVKPPHGEVVERIFIHLDRRSPPGQYAAYGGRLVPIYNYFQAALLLYEDRLLSPASLLRVVEAMGAEGYTATALANSLQDLMRRGFLQFALLRELGSLLAQTPEVLGQPASLFGKAFGDAVRGLEHPDRSPPPRLAQIEYLALAAHTREKHRRELFPSLSWLE